MRRCVPSALAAGLLLVAPIVSGDPERSRAIAPIISHIKRFPVESTALGAAGYSKRLRALEIEFRHGAIYRYLDVELSVYQELMRAPSKARYYDENIRRKYRSLHVRPRSG